MKRIQYGLIFLCAAALLYGCSSRKDQIEPSSSGTDVDIRIPQTTQETETPPQSVEETAPETVIIDADWSGYFDGMNGAAVVYDPSENRYQIYNEPVANTRRSPCSTFKIISSLIGLENGIIEAEDSMRAWSGERFWNAEWNKDIRFDEAFRSSCVWYFREIIDETGEDLMQTELDRLRYGNRDISDWKGIANTNNQNRALTGFWIESSLQISPREQTEVLERIFGEESGYSEAAQNQLKQVMLLSDQTDPGVVIYGKTGMGKAHGVVADAWFTGFADMDDRRIYFCVYLGETPGADVSSTKAKEIAANIIGSATKSPDL